MKKNEDLAILQAKREQAAGIRNEIADALKIARIKLAVAGSIDPEGTTAFLDGFTQEVMASYQGKTSSLRLVASRKYAGGRKYNHICDILSTRPGRTATIQEVADELLRHGADLGSRPLGAVKTTVTSNLTRAGRNYLELSADKERIIMRHEPKKEEKKPLGRPRKRPT